MLRAVIHAGLHKTATTSFQKCCSGLHEELIKQGIYYPPNNSTNHNSLINNQSLNWVPAVVEAARSNAGSDGCLLLSAENLESHFQQDLPERMEAALFGSGVKRMDWVLCFRRPFETYSSLYGQLSLSRNNRGARSILEFGATGHLIAAKHTLTLQNRAHNQQFHFNYPQLISDLRRRLSGNVLGLNFKDFAQTDPVPGDLLVQGIGRNGKGLSDLNSALPKHRNSSPSHEQIERNYLRRFFAFEETEEGSEPVWFAEAVKARLQQREAQEASIRRLFKQTFANWHKAITPRASVEQMLRP